MSEAGVVAIIVAAITAVPAAMTAFLAVRVKHIGRDAAAAARQLDNNGGSTTKDAIDRIETKLTTDHHRIRGLEQRLDDHIQQSQVIINLLKEKRP